VALKLDPPPSVVELVTSYYDGNKVIDKNQADAIWKKWLNALYEKVKEIVEDEWGKGDLTLDAWGTPKVTMDTSLFHGLFTFDVPATMWLINENGTETPNSASTKATSIDGRLNVTSGGTASDTCEVESRRHPRYQPDRGLKYAASLGFKGANLDGILKAGLIAADNGVYFKTIGDGELCACIFSGGVETHSEQITFPFEIDITKGNIYDIRLQWRGVGNVEYFAGNPATGHLELVHKIELLGTLDEKLSIENPALSIGFHAENVSEEVSLWCGCADITSEGGGIDREQYGEHTADRTVTSGAADTQGILALRNPVLAPNGKTNTRDLSLARITITADKKSSFKVYQTRDATAIVAGSWTTGRTGSFVEGNHTFTSCDLTKMEPFSSFKPAAGQSIIKDNPSKQVIDFFGIHGDYIVIACTAGTNVLTEVSIEWGEEI
jgi:hypothetical protein